MLRGEKVNLSDEPSLETLTGFFVCLYTALEFNANITKFLENKALFLLENINSPEVIIKICFSGFSSILLQM